jgi:uncharacterized protein (DUF362 family)
VEEKMNKRMTRRQFLGLAAAGLLAGCSPISRAADTSAVATRRAEVVRFHPVAPSKVIHARHAGVWSGEVLSPDALQQMLDASLTALTGLTDAAEAWRTLFAPHERVAIKVNVIGGSDFWTHAPLVTAVTDRLQEAGVPAKQIVIFDRLTDELEGAGFTVNRDDRGVRCYGTGFDYTKGWDLIGSPVRLSNILLECDALINMPILKEHGTSGISFAMKNHYGTFDRPERYHENISEAIAELNVLPPIKERTRLIIGDMLSIVGAVSGSWSSAVPGDSILMSFDPVAHDTVGLQVFTETATAEGGNPDLATRLATPWLENGAEMGLGTNDLDSINWMEVNLA